MSRKESLVHQIHTNSATAAGKRGKGSAGKRADIKAKVTGFRTDAKEIRVEMQEARAVRKHVSATVKEARAVLRGHESALRKADAAIARIAKRSDSIKAKISRLVA